MYIAGFFILFRRRVVYSVQEPSLIQGRKSDMYIIARFNHEYGNFPNKSAKTSYETVLQGIIVSSEKNDNKLK